MSPVLELLSSLVAIPSVNPTGGEVDETHGERRVAQFLSGWLAARKIPFETQEVWPGRHNVLARLEGGDGPSVVFEAHMDTVEVGGMSIEPFNPVIREGRLHGRGACDDKGSLAAMLIALEQTARAGTPPGDVMLAATVDEEYRASGITKLVESGFVADGAVVGEPTGLRLIIAHKGAMRLQIVTHGQTAHSSEPEKGDSAIYHMARVVQALEEYAATLAGRPEHALVGRPACSVGLIRGGQAPNVVPDRCEITVDRRMLPGEEPEAVRGEVETWLSGRLPGAPVTMEVMLYGMGMETPPEAPIVSRCARALDRVLGSHQVAGVQYGSDAGRLSQGGTPAVIIGPGEIDQAHTADEWVSVEQVEAAVRVYRGIMAEA